MVRSYYDQFGEAIANFGCGYVLKLKPHLPDLGRHEISEDEAFLCWAFYLGMLSMESMLAVVALTRVNAVHMAFALTRPLYEYLTKLEYYARHKSEAKRSYASIASRMLFHGNHYGNLAPEIIEAMRPHHEAWTDYEPQASFKSMFKFRQATEELYPQRATRLMTEFYEMPGDFLHAANTKLHDIIGRENLATTAYSPNKTVSDACIHFLCILSLLRDEFPEVYGDDPHLDSAVMDYVELAGDHCLWRTEPEGFD